MITYSINHSNELFKLNTNFEDVSWFMEKL